MSTIESNFNGYPKVTDWDKVYFLLQQANSQGFNAATKKEIVQQLFGDVAIQGADYEDLPVSTSSAVVPLPIPDAELKYGFLANGKYSQPNGPTLEYSATQWGLTLFDGDKWVKKFTLDLPKQQGVDVINPTGGELPKEKAVAEYVATKTVPLKHGKNYFNPANSKNDQLISNSGNISNGAGAVGWAWSGLIDISDIPDNSYIYLSTDRNRLGAALFPAAASSQPLPTGGRFSSTSTQGAFQKLAGDKYFGFNLKSPTETAFTWGQVEKGSVGTTREDYMSIVVAQNVEGLTESIATSNNALSKARTSEEKLEAITVQKSESGNRLNPGFKVPNSLINFADGSWTTAGAASSYNGLDKIKLKASTNYSFLKNNNTALVVRQACFFDIDGVYKNAYNIQNSFSNFTSPPFECYIKASIIKTQGEDFTIMGLVESGQVWVPYSFYNDFALSNQKETALKANDLVATIQDVKNLVSSTGSGFKFRIDPFGNMTINDGSNNIIAGQIANKKGFAGNDIFNFVQSSFKGVTVGSADDAAPMHILNTTLGGNHGYNHYHATIANHGLTNIDLYKEFTQGTTKFYPIRIIDTNKIAFISENKSGSDFVYNFTALDIGTITLGTTDFTITAVTSEQLYPSSGIVRLETFIDNRKITVPTSPQILTGSAKTIKIAEEYSIYNTSNMITRGKARAGQDLPPSMVGDTVASVRNVYSFEGYSCVVDTEVLFEQPVAFTDIMGNQAVRIGFDPLYYLPNSLPINGVDLRKPYKIPISSSNPSIFIPVNNNDPLNPPDRLIQYYGDCGFMLAYLPGYNDYSKTGRLFEIRGNSGKTYPHTYESSKIGNSTSENQYLNCTLIRVYTDLSLSRKDGRMSYFVGYKDDETFIWIDYSASMFDNIFIDIPKLNGKKINIIQSKNTTLVSKTFNQGLIVNATYVEGETAFLVIKI